MRTATICTDDCRQCRDVSAWLGRGGAANITTIYDFWYDREPYYGGASQSPCQFNRTDFSGGRYATRMGSALSAVNNFNLDEPLT